MQNFGNHMEYRDITQIRYNIQIQKEEIGQRTERIKHIGTKFQFQRHNQLRGGHKVYFYSQNFDFLNVSQESKQCTQ